MRYRLLYGSSTLLITNLLKPHTFLKVTRWKTVGCKVIDLVMPYISLWDTVDWLRGVAKQLYSYHSWAWRTKQGIFVLSCVHMFTSCTIVPHSIFIHYFLLTTIFAFSRCLHALSELYWTMARWCQQGRLMQCCGSRDILAHSYTDTIKDKKFDDVKQHQTEVTYNIHNTSVMHQFSV